jgi:fatty acid desaturase
MAESGIPKTPSKIKITPPEYTIKEVHDAIPPHCFRPSTLLSIAYILNDVALVACLGYIAVTQFPGIQNQHLRTLAWATYAFCQGCVFTGLWELAHECGHGALSGTKWINDAMGLVIHSLLLVPYHSWRLTHSTHHKTTNNIEKDIAFVPDLKKDYFAKRDARGTLLKTWELVEDMPIMVLLELIGHQLVAFPTYLLINNFALPRMAAAPWWKRSHFYYGGDGPNFKPRDRGDIILSNLGVVLSVCLLWAAVQLFGGWTMMKLYGFPYLWTNHWIRKMSPLNSIKRQFLTLTSHDNIPPTYRYLVTLLLQQILELR